MEAKRTIKTDLKLKDIRIKENQVVDFETGEVINLIANLKEIYGEEPFTMTVTAKEEEILDIETADFD
ncbi:MAG: hypothetical protein J6O49_00190 [Bacteroidaceae bacterium]|jgi:hypothetical protein|nr:hypothetical protein [Bacteroidaceae bacterium]